MSLYTAVLEVVVWIVLGVILCFAVGEALDTLQDRRRKKRYNRRNR